MELKRNPMGQFPPTGPKQSTLIQPFINISKASTPVRMRVIPPGSQMNSTPVSINKIVGQMHKSPNNKENFQNNQPKNDIFPKNDYSSKMHGARNDQENRVNLSPILALNRKLHEGPRNNSKKSLTPENHKVNQDYDGFAQEERKFQKNYVSNTSLNDSKGSSNFNSTANLSSLRGSNCFKALIQNRCKSPNRFENSNGNGKIMPKRQSTPLLKESLSSNQLFRNAGYDSRSKLTESRSFDQLRGIAGHRMQGSEIKCMNNDGKKAKYKVLNSDDEKFNSEHTQLYFCSKCTIPLVQQGFIVEEIGKEISHEGHQSSESGRYSQYKMKLQTRRKNTECHLIEIGDREEEEIGQLEQYYENIFAFLERQRVMDRQQLENYYKEKREEPLAYTKEVNFYIESIDEAIRNPFQKNIKLNDVEHLLSYDIPTVNVDQLCIFQDNIDDLTAKFSQVYDLQLKIHLQQSNYPSQTQKHKDSDIVGNRNHAMRFSFEKLLGGGGMIANNNKMKKDIIDPLMEVDEEQYAEYEAAEPPKQEHEAFRDLFPEEQETNRLNTDIYSPTFKNI